MAMNEYTTDPAAFDAFALTYDDDFTNPGTVTTIEGAGYYPQATTNFLIGATIKL